MSTDSSSASGDAHYDTVDQAVSTNTIPHHWAVESPEDGEKRGRHAVAPLTGTVGH